MSKPKLENWFLVQLTQPVLVAKIYNDDYYFNGSEMMTDYIIDIDVKNRLVYTKNNTYKLGEPDKVWKGTFV